MFGHLARVRPRGACRAHGRGLDELEAVLKSKSDLTIDEIQRDMHVRTGLRVSQSTVCRMLHARNYTRKQIDLVARAADDDEREEWGDKIWRKYWAHQLVFVDESGVNNKTAQRRFGRSVRGERARRSVFKFCQEKYSVVGGYTSNGMLGEVDVIKGGYNAQSFAAAMREHVIPYLQEYDKTNEHCVVVLDNCSIHYDDDWMEDVWAAGAIIEFLPPYSLIFNPIEFAFGDVKGWIRRHRDELSASFDDDVEAFLKHAFEQMCGMTAPDGQARSAFRRCEWEAEGQGQGVPVYCTWRRDRNQLRSNDSKLGTTIRRALIAVIATTRTPIRYYILR
mmetsp:Transcript_23413/g.63475  ORF Transcript_23413/g.63475 Transcript_23413/m.63475 type:complete len:335 (+) Transcript_23413:202-1206(+)